MEVKDDFGGIVKSVRLPICPETMDYFADSPSHGTFCLGASTDGLLVRFLAHLNICKNCLLDMWSRNRQNEVAELQIQRSWKKQNKF